MAKISWSGRESLSVGNTRPSCSNNAFLGCCNWKKIFNEFHKKLIKKIFKLIRTIQVLHYLYIKIRERQRCLSYLCQSTIHLVLGSEGDFSRGGSLPIFFAFIILCLCHNFPKKIFYQQPQKWDSDGGGRGRYLALNLRYD